MSDDCLLLDRDPKEDEVCELMIVEWIGFQGLGNHNSSSISPVQNSTWGAITYITQVEVGNLANKLLEIALHLPH